MSFMVTFTCVNLFRPVQLFQQHNPCQLMRKCHRTHGHFLIRARQHIFTQSKASADHKYKMAYPAGFQFRQVPGQFF